MKTNPLLYQDTNAVGLSHCFYGTVTNHLLMAFPKPSGPFAVGTVDRVMVDPARTNAIRTALGPWTGRGRQCLPRLVFRYLPQGRDTAASNQSGNLQRPKEMKIEEDSYRPKRGYWFAVS